MNEHPSRIWLPRAVTRRQLIIGAGAAALLAACGDDDDDDVTSGTGTTPGGTTGGTAPAGTSAPAGAAVPGGTLRVGIVGSTNDLIDGQYIVNKADQARLVAGWETLVNYDADFNISYEHGLAEEVEAQAADLFVIRLKDGITFHDGKPVTADDVIYSFQRLIDPDLAIAPALAELLDAGGLTKVDDRTVEVQLLTPTVTFLNQLAEYAYTVVPAGYARFEGDAATQIGTGPYVLQSFTPGAESVHTKNPNYWGEGLPYLDEVQIIDFADAAALVNALSAGQIDAAVDIPFAQVRGIESDSNLRILESEAGSWLTITMAIDQPPFDDVRVRQAMRLICDREEIVQRVLSGHGRVGNDMYGVFDACYPADFPQRTQDIEAAKALLAEAGQENLSVDLFAPDDTAGLPDLIAVFADQANAAGVTVNAQVLDGGTYWGEEYTKRTFATSFWGTRPYLNQVQQGSLKTAVYPETHWPPEGSDFQAKYEAAIAETDDAARCAIIEEMQQEEYDEGGFIIPIFNNLLDATAANVQGLVARPNVLNLDHFGRGYKNIWLQS